MAKYKNIFKIINKGTVEELEAFIKENPESLNIKSSFFSGGRSPLSYAIANDATEFAKIILNCGANPNQKSKNHNTALHEAAQKGNIEILERLLAHENIDLNAAGSMGFSALHTAIWHKHDDAAILLIESGIDIELTDRDRWTALHFAAVRDNPSIFKRLLSAGANRHALDNNFRSPYKRTSDNEIHKLHNEFPLVKDDDLKDPVVADTFVKENDSAVSITKVFEASASRQKIIYDFSDRSITTITTEPDGKVQSIGAFNTAVSKQQLQKAAEFLNENSGQLHGFPLAQII